MKKYLSEVLGTMILVLIGCGVASTSDSVIVIAFAFGFGVMVPIYIFGSISGGHFNPAVSIANYFTGKLSLNNMIFYIISQTIGAFIGVIILGLILGFDVSFGVNIVNTQYSLYQGMIFEFIFTFIFVLTILGTTSKNANKSIAGIVIGLTLTVVHIFGIPVTGTSVNPARSIAPAIISGNLSAITQLWIFIVMPILGAIVAAIIWEVIFSGKETNE